MIRKKFPFFVLVLLVLLVAPAFSETIKVDIQNFKFQPDTITINLRDSVIWTNQQDFVAHTVTENNGLWTSAALAKGKTYAVVFNQAGTFGYHCSIHPSMTGKIIVRTDTQTRIKIGKNIITADPKVLPITLNLNNRNQNQVYLGSYIVNAQSGCANCHSCPTYAVGHNPYKGEAKQLNATTYLAGGVAFGPVISANLTPDAAGNPAGLSLSQFKSLLRTGHDPDVPGAILQVMPWPLFGMMSAYDLEAVYAYLQSIPSASTPVTTCGLGQ